MIGYSDSNAHGTIGVLLLDIALFIPSIPQSPASVYAQECPSGFLFMNEIR